MNATFQITQTLAAPGHEARRDVFRIFVRVGEDGLIVGDIAAHTKLLLSTRSHHLWTLVTDGLIAKVFTGSTVAMIFVATDFGGLSPSCACGTISSIAALLVIGVPLSAVMAFLLEPFMVAYVPADMVAQAVGSESIGAILAASGVTFLPAAIAVWALAKRSEFFRYCHFFKDRRYRCKAHSHERRCSQYNLQHCAITWCRPRCRPQTQVKSYRPSVGRIRC